MASLVFWREAPKNKRCHNFLRTYQLSEAARQVIAANLNPQRGSSHALHDVMSRYPEESYLVTEAWWKENASQLVSGVAMDSSSAASSSPMLPIALSILGIGGGLWVWNRASAPPEKKKRSKLPSDDSHIDETGEPDFEKLIEKEGKHHKALEKSAATPMELMITQGTRRIDRLARHALTPRQPVPKITTVAVAGELSPLRSKL